MHFFLLRSMVLSGSASILTWFPSGKSCIALYLHKSRCLRSGWYLTRTHCVREGSSVWCVVYRGILIFFLLLSQSGEPDQLTLYFFNWVLPFHVRSRGNEPQICLGGMQTHPRWLSVQQNKLISRNYLSWYQRKTASLWNTLC